MKLGRRELLTMAGVAGSGAAFLAYAPRERPAPDLPGTSGTWVARIVRAAAEHRHRLHFDGRSFSGPAWDRLLEAARGARFFLVGEEHGIAENPRLAAQLFVALAPAGYSRLAIEISPPMAGELDRALLNGGMPALRRLTSGERSWVAFYTLREEAGLLAAARNAIPSAQTVLWGLDYEVAADRRLFEMLGGHAMPSAAAAALEAVVAASDRAWSRFRETRNPEHIYSFAGDPDLVRAVRAAWPGAPAVARWVLDTLEETLEINRLWLADDNYGSNLRRARLLRANFLRHWRDARAAGDRPRVMLKLGASHALRGLNTIGTFDVGTLVPEIAAIDREDSFHLLVLAGVDSETAGFDPGAFSYRAARRLGFARGLEPVTSQAWPDSFTLIDLRPLRRLVRSDAPGLSAHLLRCVHGYDAVLVMSGSTASAELGS